MSEKSMKPFRQGDVCIVPVDASEVPKGAKPVARENGSIILAYGEVTGHHHGIVDPAAVLLSFDPRSVALPEIRLPEERYLTLPEPATLRQFSSNPGEVEGVDLHGPIELPAGNFRVVIQRQFEHGRFKQVVD